MCYPARAATNSPLPQTINSFLVNADVINIKPLREYFVINSLCATPTSTDRQIQDEIFGLVERPSVGAVFWVVIGVIFFSIHKKADPVGVPFNGVNVE